MDEIYELQGKGNDQTRTYFMEDPLCLREIYWAYGGLVTINLDVEKLSIKSPEFQAMGSKNQKLSA